MLKLRCKKELSKKVKECEVKILVGDICNAIHPNNNIFHVTAKSGEILELNQKFVKEHFTTTI
jgi:hypothetical protein